MDEILERLGDALDAVNKGNAEADEARGDALQRMQAKGYTVRSHAGVEVARVPGTEKLRTRRLKGGNANGDSDDDTLPEADAEDGGGEAGADQLESAGG